MSKNLLDLTSNIIETINLDIQKFIMHEEISYKDLEKLLIHFDIQRSAFSQNYILRFYASIAAQKLDEKRCQYPADWKEAFKERWFPKWLLKRYPVKYTYIEMKAVQLYPKIQLPNGYGPCIEVVKWNGFEE